jgi:ArsR family transcriptional regulator
MSDPALPPLHQEHAAQLFRLLGDEKRLRLLLVLAEHDEVTVASLLEAVDLTGQALSHHLQLLRMSWVITRQRRGQTNAYSLTSGLVRSLIRYVVP